MGRLLHMFRLPFFHLLAPLLLSIIAVPAFAQTIPFEAGRWNLARAEVKEHRGRSCLAGTAWLDNAKIKDGVVEVDRLVTGKTSYPGIIFRRTADGEFERIYLRPHRAGHYPDAVQYSPTFNGNEAWQLYNGPGYTADCYLPPDNWIRLRLEFRDAKARLFIGGEAKPALVVNDLKHVPTHGSVGLDAPADGSAYFGDALRASFGCIGTPDPVDPLLLGPAATAPPILVIGTTGDPATPYEWAVELADFLDSGVLYTVEGEGHTAYTSIECVTPVVDAYLIDLEVPAPDGSCVDDTDPDSIFLPVGESEVDQLIAFFDCLIDEGADVPAITVADVLADPSGEQLLDGVDFADPATIAAVGECQSLLSF